MGVCCTIAIVVIICYVGYSMLESSNERYEADQRNIRETVGQYENAKKRFEETLSDFFDNSKSLHYDGVYGAVRTYSKAYTSLTNHVFSMSGANRKLKNLCEGYDYSGVISNYSILAEEFHKFGHTIDSMPLTLLMDHRHYGNVLYGQWKNIRAMDKSNVDNIIDDYERSLSSRNYSYIFKFNPYTILQCIWFYATEKPYSVERFKKAVNIFNSIVPKSHVEVTVAELYAINKLGGESGLRERIHTILKESHTSEELTLIASALMWMNAYQAENMILQHMLNEGIKMPEKAQERLHSLANGGGKFPSSFDVASNSSELYFDVSPLTWKEDEFSGLFESLSFQEKTLTYSLAIRDENKDLFITNGISVPETNEILSKLRSVFADEYGSSVAVESKKCIALSGSGEENMVGILVESKECPQMGILVHIARIGKKLNIKFYTLFEPRGIELEVQKQQLFSLYKKLSPTVVMWESSMKDTVLLAFQQLLNTDSQTTGDDTNAANDYDGPIF